MGRIARSTGHLAVTAVLLILIAGCAGGGPAAPSRSPDTPAAAGQRPAAGPSPQLKTLAKRYMAIAVPANRRLDTANDGFEDHARDDLAAARSDLRAEVATERRFDRQLARIPFPPPIAAMAQALIKANQSRITMTDLQASSASLAELRSFSRSHRAADAAVEDQVRRIRRALHLPPPSDS
ncbi:MAG TPA: hypothetical protein VH637_23575 [Streptosporangiaceae bacterium]|jgi:hypothetical protein